MRAQRAPLGLWLWNNLTLALSQKDMCLRKFTQLLKTFLFRRNSAHCDFLLKCAVYKHIYLLVVPMWPSWRHTEHRWQKWQMQDVQPQRERWWSCSRDGSVLNMPRSHKTVTGSMTLQLIVMLLMKLSARRLMSLLVVDDKAGKMECDMPVLYSHKLWYSRIFSCGF